MSEHEITISRSCRLQELSEMQQRLKGLRKQLHYHLVEVFKVGEGHDSVWHDWLLNSCRHRGIGTTY